ncbi:MAG TPA: dolichyl-phosphate beta-glucosyltransferase [Candidatus Dormibacteraeota bacterium]|nr:dolichyl-phosphate beta-glucosyltransferase [Candidatus Dormibacteraeota bacterium]
MLSIVVPAYNESGRLPASLRRIREHFDAAGEDYEVIVVDDGSSDETHATSTALAAGWPQLTVLRFERNRGKGAAVREGMLHARGEHRLFTDADLSTPLEELPRLRAELRGQTRVAIASRGLPDSRIEVHQQKRRELMGRTYNKLLQLLVLRGIQDSQCGFKVFTAEAAVACFEPLRTMRFGFDAEVLLRAQALGWRIAEVPVRWSHVEASRVNSVRDASRMLWDLVVLRTRRGR